jgi:hypothetical protein
MPTEWTILGSNDKVTWFHLDQRQNVKWSDYYHTREFSVVARESFKFLRFSTRLPTYATLRVLDLAVSVDFCSIAVVNKSCQSDTVPRA